MSDHADDGDVSTSSSPQHTRELYDLIRAGKWDEASRRCQTHPQDARFKGGSDRWLPIHHACRWEAPLSLIRQLHEAYGEGVKTTNIQGKLPLHFACRNDASLEVIEYLLQVYGEGVKTKDKGWGSLPLHLACWGGASLEVIQYLVEAYPDGATKKDDDGKTPADCLKYNESLSEEDKAKARDILFNPPRTSPSRPTKPTSNTSTISRTTPTGASNTTATTTPTSKMTTSSGDLHPHDTPNSPTTSTWPSESTSPHGGEVDATIEHVRENASVGEEGLGRATDAADTATAAAADSRAQIESNHRSPSLTTEQHRAIQTLTRNLRDFDRSLEGVRGVPTSLSGSPDHVQKYFRSYVAAFERTYVAAQVLSTGAVKGKVMERAMMVAALENVGKGAEASGVPFVGAVSIFASLALHQMQTRQDNVLGVFQQFFCRDSHMSHVLVCRSAAEQICLRADLTDFSGGDSPPSVGKLRAKVQRAMKRIEDKLQKCHLVAVGNLEPIEVKVMDDLATVTEAVMTLWFESRGEYTTLKEGGDADRVVFMLGALGLDKVSPIAYAATTSAEAAQGGSGSSSNLAMEEVDSHIGRHAVPPSTPPSAFSQSVPSPSDEIKELKEQLKHLQKQSVLSQSEEVKELRKLVKNLQKQVDELSPTDDEETVDVPGGGNHRQKMSLASKNTRAKREADAAAAREYNQRVDTMDSNIQENAENLHLLSIETFMTRRVLTVLEARKFIKEVLVCSRGEATRTKSEDLHNHRSISTDSKGRFVLKGRSYQVGHVRRRFGTTKKLWDDESDIRFDVRNDGTWSVKCWFVRTGLEHRYNAHCKAVIRQMFGKELLA